MTYVFSNSYAMIKVDSYHSIPLEETLTFHTVIIRTNSVWNKDQNHNYYNAFSNKCSYQLPNKFLYKL